ncbi:MAG: hypothetical protein RRZ69_06575, partial [Clostridia bacterium]
MKKKIVICMALTLLLICVFATPSVAVAEEKSDVLTTPEIDLAPFDEFIKNSDMFDGMTFREKVEELSSGK